MKIRQSDNKHLWYVECEDGYIWKVCHTKEEAAKWSKKLDRIVK